MANILLHIGSEKTGTTFLQNMMHANANLLRKKYGVLYPTDHVLCERRAHHPLAAAFLPSDRRDFISPSSHCSIASLMDHLNRSIDRSHSDTVLLSAEHMSSRFDRAVIADLAEHLSAHVVHVILYVRKQDEMALSAMSTDLCCGSRDWVPIERIVPDVRRYNPLQVVEDWQAVFGRDAVTVRSYASACRTGLAEDFLRCAGLECVDLSEFEPVDRLNQRINLCEARVLHGVNQFLPTWREAASAGEPDSYHEANLLRRSLLTWLRTEQTVTHNFALDAALTLDHRETLMQRFAHINGQLADTYGFTTNDFDMRATDGSNHAARMLRPEEECQLMAQVLRIVSQRLIQSESTSVPVNWGAMRKIGQWSKRLRHH